MESNISNLFAISSMTLLLLLVKPAISDSQINLLDIGCSQYKAPNPEVFLRNVNATLADLGGQLNNTNSTGHFATAQQARGSDPVYAMVQCRNYLSTADCLACFAKSVLQIRDCGGANGARVINDGCFLRYESNSFYDQTTVEGHKRICDNRTISQRSGFKVAVERLLSNLEVATPRIAGFFAATKEEEGVIGSGAAAYGVAQCVQTLSKSGCEECLKVAHGNLGRCLPDADGRAVDAGCFLRYSEKAFFRDDQTTNLTPFLGKGGSSKNKAIIGGVSGGASLLLFVGVIIFLQLSRKPKKDRKGKESSSKIFILLSPSVFVSTFYIKPKPLILSLYLLGPQ
ncbi:hypothetical protein HHK36_033441 [Tetracentron sinense]|uniref:Gnk2-homologous domain-containing protein n=1 Tax=Tetracentron sinense TaxID=13715 RepID=A0A835CW40_TETSI|nr:hypothetical protein HHK36_033441 [Tetracentron sinense]